MHTSLHKGLPHGTAMPQRPLTFRRCFVTGFRGFFPRAPMAKNIMDGPSNFQINIQQLIHSHATDLIQIAYGVVSMPVNTAFCCRRRLGCTEGIQGVFNLVSHDPKLFGNLTTPLGHLGGNFGNVIGADCERQWRHFIRR